VTATADPGALRRAGYLPSVRAVAGRNLRKIVRTPATLIAPTVQAVTFLLIFRYVFGGAIASGALSYVDYMVPGLVTASMLFAVMGVGTDVAEDARAGVIDRFRSLPMPGSAVLVGRAVAELLVLAVAASATTAVAVATGFRPRAGLPGLLAMFGLCLLVGAVFTWVFILIGLLTRNPRAAQGVAFLVLPLTFLSSAYVPTATMAAGLRTVAAHQPVTVLIDAARGLAHGTTGSLLPALAWCAGIAAVVVPLAVAVHERRR